MGDGGHGSTWTHRRESIWSRAFYRVNASLSALVHRACFQIGAPMRTQPQSKVELEADLEDLRAKAKTLLASAQSARAEAEEESRARRTELRELRADLERREQRLSDREERLDTDVRGLEDKTRQLEELKNELKNQRRTLADLESQQQLTLERIAGMTAEQAKSELPSVAHDAKRQSVLVARDIERQAVREADARAQMIIVGAIQRLASELTSEVRGFGGPPWRRHEGRIIGREGRNIRAFEQVTGVNVMIDDTPEAVLLSCFDPVRRETARMTLTELVADGRSSGSHRGSARASKSKSRPSVCGRPRMRWLRWESLICIRHSSGARHAALPHVLRPECAQTPGGERPHRGFDGGRAWARCGSLQTCAFLHDIGKALTHEVEGSHAIVGADLARKYGEHADVVHAIEAHHNEVEVRTVEAVLVQAADAISGSRPGARRESIEAYVQRLERLEEIAGAREGVDKVFAMQAVARFG